MRSWLLVALLSAPAASQDYRLTHDEFDGSADASTVLKVAAPNPTATPDPWTVMVEFRSTRTESGDVQHRFGVAVTGEHWVFPERHEPLLLLVRSVEWGPWDRRSLRYVAKWSELDYRSADTVEVVAFDVGTIEELRRLCDAVAIKFRLQGHHTLERLIAPEVLSFDRFDDFVEREILPTEPTSEAGALAKRIHDLYSKRQRRERGDKLDVFIYDEIPEKLRVQLVQILGEALPAEDEFYQELHAILCREYGRLVLHGERRPSLDGVSFTTPAPSYREVFMGFLLEAEGVDHIIDAVELSLRFLERVARKEVTGDVVSEINQRFRYAGVGYQYESGQVIRVDRKITHAEIVKPALQLLSEPQFKGPNDEYLSAHKHYREGDTKGAVRDCLNALESTLKVICREREWSHDPNATARELISVVLKKKLVPSYLQSQFSALRSTLESGIPTVRNKEGGHGQGPEVKDVPRHLAAYQLHLTATAIVFLVDSHKSLEEPES